MRAPEARIQVRDVINGAIKNPIIRAILKPYIERILKALVKWLVDNGLIEDPDKR